MAQANIIPLSACLVPDVIGRNQGEAEGLIAGTGLQSVKSTTYDPSIPVGAVISQDPPSGTERNPCQGKVTIIVSLGPVPPTATPIPPANTPTLEPSIVPPTLIPSTNTPLPQSTRLTLIKLTGAETNASSSYDPQDRNGYWPKNAIDGDPDTIWTTANHETIGGWIEVSLANSHTIAGIRFNTRGPEDINAQIQDATLTFSDGSKQKIHLKNLKGWQYIEISPISTSLIRITVDSIYPGTLSSDSVFIAEIEFLGKE